jgi:DNA-binding transcriptional MocR family regulator
MTLVQPDTQSTLYEVVAQRICRLIEAGTLRPGERIPSVRKLSQQTDVSVSTVLQAYRLLEDRGQVEARPQSGYFVRGTHWQRAPEPEICGPSDGCTAVTVAELAERVMLEGRRTDLVQLGAALHGSEAMPIRQLNRIAAAVARRSPAAGMTYCVPPGDHGLCVQVARRALDAGATLAPDEVIVTSGAMEAIGFCLRAVTKPGDAVAIESPTFYGILQLLDVLDLRAVEVPTDPRTGVCLDALAAAMDRAAAGASPVRACLFVGNFNNPLGSCMPDDQKQRLVEMLDARGVPLIEDDIYGELSFDGRRPRTAKSFDATGNVLLCSSFSKTLAPGYRIGWCAPGRHYEKVRRLKLFTNIATATLPQKAIAEFLATGGYDHHLRRVRRSYHENLMRIAAAVAEHFPPGTKLTRPQGGMVLWVELPEGSDALKLHAAALARGISIAPGPIFSASGKFVNCVRLTCSAWSETVAGAIRTVGELAKAL